MILLRPDGSAVLTDFGIAALDDGESLPTTGELVGSLEYMASERLLWALAGTAPPAGAVVRGLFNRACAQDNRGTMIVRVSVKHPS
ncbi:hypothetical protein [Streptomyces sp. uw30]|uniref:hypothetical protein n=1 Tax=Streptomyces sp. uw30 TaxID=1828179 RepID=UPI0016510349|nr:hypothetical protein [Streptomyces sp. uw30]